MSAEYSSAVACLFCEDVRAEASGQASLIGVFPTRIALRKFPFTLPKLAVYSLIRCQLDRPPKSLSLQLTYPWEEEPIIADAPTEQLVAHEMKEAMENGDSAFFFTLHLPIIDFEVKSPGKVKASIIIDGKEHRAGSLNFKLIEEKSFQNTMA